MDGTSGVALDLGVPLFGMDTKAARKQHGFNSESAPWLCGTSSVMIETPHIRLRCWRESDREVFAAMNADPEVMLDQGGPLSREKSDAKLDRYTAAFVRYGFCRWVIEARDGEFLGYAGTMPSPSEHRLGPHVEIGWRLVRRAWAHGYATEAAGAALKDAFDRAGW